MSWKEDLEREMSRAWEAQRSGNEGKARAGARRAVGVAVEEFQRRFPGKTYGRDFIARLRGLAVDPDVPEAVRRAAERLQARLTPDFRSQSVDPINDAEIILEHILSRLK